MRAKQFLYFFTRPIATFMYWFDFKRNSVLRDRRNVIKELNKRDFIKTTESLLLEQSLILTPFINEEFLKINCYLKAVEIFEEKKRKGELDELNTVVK